MARQSFKLNVHEKRALIACEETISRAVREKQEVLKSILSAHDINKIPPDLEWDTDTDIVSLTADEPKPTA